MIICTSQLDKFSDMSSKRLVSLNRTCSRVYRRKNRGTDFRDGALLLESISVERSDWSVAATVFKIWKKACTCYASRQSDMSVKPRVSYKLSPNEEVRLQKPHLVLCHKMLSSVSLPPSHRAHMRRACRRSLWYWFILHAGRGSTFTARGASQSSSCPGMNTCI